MRAWTAAGLFVVGDVEEELEDHDVIVGKCLFPGVDVVEVPAGLFFAHVSVDAGGEDVFVVRAVEDADHAAGRDLGLAAPEEVVAGFKGGGDFEGGYVAALGVDAGENVADGTVFAGSVHALENDKEGLGLGGEEGFLEVGQLLAALFQDGGGGFGVFEGPGGVGLDGGKLDFGVGLDEVRRFQLHAACFLGSRGEKRTLRAQRTPGCATGAVPRKASRSCEQENLDRGGCFGLFDLGRDDVGGFAGLGGIGGLVGDALHAVFKAAEAFAEAFAEFGKLFAAEGERRRQQPKRSGGSV